jgi:YesN/AraC family two-component response regulator
MTEKTMLNRSDSEFIENTGVSICIADIRYLAPHVHDCILEFVYCMQGSINVSLGYEIHALQEGEFLSIDHDVHMLYSDERNVTATFHLNIKTGTNEKTSIEHMFFVCPNEEPNNRLEKHLNEMQYIFIGMLLLLSTDVRSDQRRALTKAKEKIIEIMTNNFTIAEYCNAEAAFSDEISAQVDTIIHYLVERYSERITLNDLSRLLHLNKNYVSQFMKRYLPGYTEWLGFIRATMSTRLLLESASSIENISEAVGFSGKKYYYSMFRRWYGCTPTEYRKIYLQHIGRQDEYERIGVDEISSLIEANVNRLFLGRLEWD